MKEYYCSDYYTVDLALLMGLSSLYKIPIEDLLAAFGLNSDKADIKCKDLEKEFAAYEVEI